MKCEECTEDVNVPQALPQVPQVQVPQVPQNVTVLMNIVTPRANWFVRGSGSTLTCFRCAEHGHIRSACMYWKTRMCPLRQCASETCPHAHSYAELRNPKIAKCVRVTKVNGKITVLGCGRIGHTYRACMFTDCPRTVSL